MMILSAIAEPESSSRICSWMRIALLKYCSAPLGFGVYVRLSNSCVNARKECVAAVSDFTFVMICSIAV